MPRNDNISVYFPFFFRFNQVFCLQKEYPLIVAEPSAASSGTEANRNDRICSSTAATELPAAAAEKPAAWRPLRSASSKGKDFLRHYFDRRRDSRSAEAHQQQQQQQQRTSSSPGEPSRKKSTTDSLGAEWPRIAGGDGFDDHTATSAGAAASSACAAAECNVSVGDEISSAGGTRGDGDDEGSTSGHHVSSGSTGAAGAGASRDGWRIGEGLSVPVDGADSIWNRLKVFLDGQAGVEGGVRAASGGGGCAGGGGDGSGRVGGTEGEDAARGSSRRQVKDGASREAAERREAVVRAIRWAWQVREVVLFSVCVFVCFVMATYGWFAGWRLNLIRAWYCW